MSMEESLHNLPDADKEKAAALQRVVAEVRDTIGEHLTAEVLPEDISVVGAHREFFQSPSYQKAGYGFIPERYPQYDRQLTVLKLADDTQTIVIEGRAYSGNPWAVGHAVSGGIDQRPMKTVVYLHDNEQTVVEFDDGEMNVYEGHGPEEFLAEVRRTLGAPVEGMAETY